MWSSCTFAEHLDSSCGQAGLYERHIKPQMQRIVQYSLACATVSTPTPAACPMITALLSQTSAWICLILCFVLRGSIAAQLHALHNGALVHGCRLVQGL